jgi:hypothetical protein
MMVAGDDGGGARGAAGGGGGGGDEDPGSYCCASLGCYLFVWPVHRVVAAFSSHFVFKLRRTGGLTQLHE